jgi:hypothetical protein
MNRFLLALTLSFVGLLGAAQMAAAAAPADAALGTWNLNLTKSKFHGDTAPKSMTRVYSAGAAGTDLKVTGVAADGTPISQSVTLTYDGKDCAMTGGTTYDTLSLTKINGSTVKSELKKGGEIVGHTTRTVSGKGKVLTLSTSLKTAKGGTVHDLAVYDKQ